MLASACTNGDDSKTSNTTDDSGTTPDPVKPDGVSNLVVTPSDVYPSVFTVEWETDQAGTSLVEWGPSNRYGSATPSSSATTTEHRVLVVGPKPGEITHFRAVSMIDGEDYGTEDQTFDAAGAPNDLPGLDVDEQVDGAYATGLRGVALFGLLYGNELVDADGDAVWWKGFEAGNDDQVVQARYFPDDKTKVAFMYNDVTREQDLCRIETERLDGTPLDSALCEWGHHDFTILADGRFAYLYADIRDYRGDQVVGDRVVLVDADGSNPTTIWNAWDELTPDASIFENDPFYPDALDWTHGNSLNYDEGTNSLTLSLHNLNTIYNLSLTGEVNWRLGDEGDFDIEGNNTRFVHQHGAKLVPGTDNEVTLFDNGSGSDKSEAAHYRLNFDDMTAERVWSEDNGGRYTSFILGDAMTVGDGNYFVSWGSEGEVTEFTPDGDVVWRASGDLGTTTGYISMNPQLGGSY